MIIDISSSSVGVAQVTCATEGTDVHFATREEIKFQEDLNYQKFISDTIKVLKSTIHLAQKSGKLRPTETHCILASPWFVTESRRIFYSDHKPFRVTKELVNRLIKSEIERFKKEEIERNGGKLGRDTVLIESKITNIQLNGYETASPVGKMAENISASLFVSISSREVKEKFTQAIIGELHHDNIHFHTLPAVAIGTLIDIPDTPERFVFVSISGEITDVIIIKEKAISEILSFPLGANFILRWLGKRLSVTSENVPPVLELYFAKKLETWEASVVLKTIDYLRPEWLRGFTGTLEQSPFEYLMPRDVFLLADINMGQLFADLISSKDLSRFIQSNQPFKVKILNQNVFGGLKQMTYTHLDTFLILETLFIRKLLGV